MFLIVIIAAFIGIAPAVSLAAMYQFTDETGGQPFTNILPVGKKYQVIVPDKARKSAPAATSFRGKVSTVAYDKSINHHASLLGVDPLLVKAVMKAESNFNPGAVSPKGAQGLMQLMPGTAKLMKVDDPFDPDDNIKGGTGYLRVLHEVFKGDIDLVLAGYNAGPMRVVEHNMKVPPIEETKNYIKRVKQYYNKLKSDNNDG